MRVRGIQRQGRICQQASAGTRVALNLSGIEVGEVQRGDTLVLPSTLQAVDTVDAEITLLPDAPAVSHRTRVQLHSFTSETIAIVSIYGYRTVDRGGYSVGAPDARRSDCDCSRRPLRAAPAFARANHRRRTSDRLPPRPHTPKKAAWAWLQRIKDASEADQIQLRVERCRAEGISIARLAQEMGWTVDAVQAAMPPMLRRGSLRLLGSRLLFSSTALQEAGEQIRTLISSTSAGAVPAGIRRASCKIRCISRLRSSVLFWPI